MGNKRALIIENESVYVEYYKNGINDSNFTFDIDICDIKKIINRSFEDVIKDKEYDLFVIDVNISEKSGCELGLEFLKFLKDNKKVFNYIVISEFGISNLKNSDLIDEDYFFSKVDNQDDLIETAIELTINELWD